jgi:hypothetical protein
MLKLSKWTINLGEINMEIMVQIVVEHTFKLIPPKKLHSKILKVAILSIPAKPKHDKKIRLLTS